MIIQKIKHNRRTVAFIGKRMDGQIYFAFGTPSQQGGKNEKSNENSRRKSKRQRIIEE